MRQESFKAWATDVTHNRQASVVQYADPKAAATAAATLVFKNYPDEQSLCGATMPEAQHEAALARLVMA